jgi:hypothetical protein
MAFQIDWLGIRWCKLWWWLHSSFSWVVNIFPILVVWVWVLPTTNFDHLDAIHLPKEHNMLGHDGFMDILIFAKTYLFEWGFLLEGANIKSSLLIGLESSPSQSTISLLKLMHHLSKCRPRILLSFNRLKIWRIWSLICSPKSKKLKY